MKIDAKFAKTATYNQDLAVYFVSEEGLKTELKRLDSYIDGIPSTLVNQGLAKPKHNHIYVAPTFGKSFSAMLALAGLGKKSELSLEKIRQIGGTITNAAKAHKAKSILIDFDPLREAGDAEMVARALTEGLMLGDYEYKEYKSVGEDDKPVDIASITLVTPDEAVLKAAAAGIKGGTLEAEATCFTRDLVNRPPRDLHPKILKEVAQKIAKESKGLITCKAYGREDLKKMGAGAILGVAQGSEFEPFLIHLDYKPEKAAKKIALVGKGVTFDSGGYSLKPSNSMEDMKMDMAGAGVVLGVFQSLLKSKPNVRIHGIMPCVENMVSDRAIRVGDIVKTLSGKTVEVQNTDAEGRLILADALTYALKQKPDMILDFATLTGACMVALGDQVAGLMTDNEALLKQIDDAASISGEQVWRLPLVADYEEDMKSDVADLSNMHKSKYGGAIFGGLFLKQFVEKTPWAHFDIAGPAFAHKPFNSYTSVGGTGFGVRTVIHWLQTL